MMAYYRHLPPDQLDTIFPRLEGLTIEVTDDCQGCGTCAQNCFVKAITVKNGKALHSAACRGCGRCARFCPNQAVRITLTKLDYQEDVLRRINDRVDFK